MKPIKPKPLPKYLRRWIEACASEHSNTLSVTLGPAKCYAILAALAHERQDEREICAIYVDEVANGGRDAKSRSVAHMLARRIRARKT